MAFSKQSSQSQWQGTHQTFFLTRVCPSWICQQARCITKHHWNHRNIINIHQASAKIAGSANPKPHQTWWCCSWGFAELRWTGVSLTNMMRAHHGTSLGGLGFTRFHQISPDFNRFHQISPDFNRFHQISPDSQGSHVPTILQRSSTAIPLELLGASSGSPSGSRPSTRRFSWI